MGINVEITNVDANGNSVAFNQDGESKTAEVVLPAQIKWAKQGKAEVGFNQEGKINFIRSLEPRTMPNNTPYKKPESNIRAISTLKVLEDVTPSEIASVYNNINATNNMKCGASTMYSRENGKYDAFLYVTTFVPKDSPLADKQGSDETI